MSSDGELKTLLESAQEDTAEARNYFASSLGSAVLAIVFFGQTIKEVLGDYLPYVVVLMLVVIGGLFLNYFLKSNETSKIRTAYMASLTQKRKHEEEVYGS